MRTLRSRLLLGTAIATSGVLLAAGVLLYALIHGALWNEFDESLAAKARSLAGMVEQERDGLELEFDEADLPEYMPAEHSEFYQVWLNGTEVFARSPSLEGRDLRLIEGPVEQPACESAALPDGRSGRILGIRFTPRSDGKAGSPGQSLEVTLVLGRETAGIERTLAQIKVAMAAVGLAAVLVSVGVLDWSVRRGLRPVARLAAQIGDVGESDLSARIDPAGIPSELLPVVDRLNDLLGRLQSAFQRERRFTADVAHELRTPLAGVRSTLEVALLKEREPEGYRKAMEESLGINQQMHRMVENLLSLARADASQLEVMNQEVDLGALIRECWNPLARAASERGISVDWHLQEPCILQSDQGKLRLVLQNILSNAATYTADRGQIRIQSASKDGQIELTVANTGSSLSPEGVERVFDRFWRGDASRRSSGQHCGLGLSLCRTLLELLGGSISAESGTGGEFRIVVRLQPFTVACGQD